MQTSIAPYYDSANRLPAPLEELHGVVKFWELIVELVRRDLIARYKRSTLGIVWTMLNPLAMMTIMVVVFSHLFGGGPKYAAHVLSGIVAWTFFAQSSHAAVGSLVWVGPLSRAIYLPRTLFALSALCTGLVNFVLSLVPLAVIMLCCGVHFHPSVVFVPVPMALLAFFSLGVALLVSSLAVRFPDVVEVYPIILSGWIYLVPVIYPAETLPPRVQFVFQWTNPMYTLIGLFRAPLLDGRIPAAGEILWCFSISTVTLLAGWYFYGKQVDNYALQG